MLVARTTRFVLQQSKSTSVLCKHLKGAQGAIATVLPQRWVPWPTISTSRRFHSIRPTNATNLSSNGFAEHTKICVIGSGNWGSAIAKIIGGNTPRLPFCHDQVNMWVYEESVDLGKGRQDLLSKVINETHENVKYLPGIQLPQNVVAVPDLATACRDATLLIFVVPHQFLPSLLPTIKQSVHWGARGVSLIKGLGKLLYE